MSGWRLSEPTALWALLLALPVLAAHLVHRRRRRLVVPFAGLLLEARAQVPGARGWRRVAEAGALAARLLALGALALALAGPRPPDPSPPPPLVLVVDADVTTAAREADGRTRLAHLLERALAEARAAGGAPVSVVRAGRVPRVLARDERDPLALAPRLGAAAAAGPEDGPADLEAALRVAQGLASPAPAVVLLSARSVPAAEARAARVLGAGATADNQALVDLALAPAAEPPRLTLRVQVDNEAPGPVERRVELRVDGRAVGEQALTLPAGGVAEAVFDVLPPPGGADGEVRLRGADAFARDDALVLRLPAPRRPSVLAVHGGQGLRPYTAALLAALGDEIQREASGAVAAADLAAAPARDVTLVDGAALPAGALRPGAYVFLAPLAGTLPFEVAGPVERPLVWRTEPGHPLVRDLALGEAWVTRAFALRPGAGLVPLAYADGDQPVVAEGEREGVRYVVLGLDPEQSDLPVRAALPLLVRNALLRLAQAPLAPLPPFVRAGGTLAPLLPLPGGPQAWATGAGVAGDDPGGAGAPGGPGARLRLAPGEPGLRLLPGASGWLVVRTGAGSTAWEGRTGVVDLDPGRRIRPAREASPPPPGRPAPSTGPGPDPVRALLLAAALLLLLDLLLSRSAAPKVAASPPRGSIGPWSTASFAKR